MNLKKILTQPIDFHMAMYSPRRRRFILTLYLILFISASIALYLRFRGHTTSPTITCGSWDTSGQIICHCNGQLTKQSCPPNAICDSGNYYCQGQCDSCCYDGSAQDVKYPHCPATSPSPSPTKYRTSCSINSDCVLINQDNFFDCCRINNCQPIDYSQSSWIAVNDKWYNQQLGSHCQSDRACPLCEPRPINDHYSAVCRSNSCQKIPR